MLGLPTKPSKALMVWSFKGKPNLTPGIALSLVNAASVIETFWVFNNLFNILIITFCFLIIKIL